MSHAVTKKEAQQQQQVQQQQQHARDTETHEHNSSANASAGLNLNLAGALSGAFSSKQKKATHTNPDGSSHSVEDKQDKGMASGAAQGNGSAYAAGNAHDGTKHQKSREVGQAQAQAKSVKGRKEIDHLGIEA